jgi:hypothetical protein
LIKFNLLHVWSEGTMTFNLTFSLILAATVLTGLLAGISLDKAIVQLPARHRMGVIGFAAFSRANDLGAGLIVYPVLGIGAALLTIIAALAVFFQGVPLADAWPLHTSALLALLHSVATARAAPNMLRLRQPADDEALLTETLDRFAKWHNLRAVLQLLNFLMLVWAAFAYVIAVH